MVKAVSRGQALEISARVATQINWDKLDGYHLQKDVIDLSPEEFGERFTLFLLTGAKPVIWKNWQPVQLVLGLTTILEYLSRLEEDGFEISSHILPLLEKSYFFKSPEELSEAILVITTPQELGFTDFRNLTFEQICSRGFAMGLKPCTSAMSFQLLHEMTNACDFWDVPLSFVNESYIRREDRSCILSAIWQPFTQKRVLRLLDVSQYGDPNSRDNRIFQSYDQFVFLHMTRKL